MKAILLNQSDLTAHIPLSDDEFIKHIREINRSHQAAVRWIGQQPWLSYYAQNSVFDIRGLYFFRLDPKAVTDLAVYNSLSAVRKKTLNEWLLSLCRNTKKTVENCRTELGQATEDTALPAYYKKYLPYAEAVYANFFAVTPVRKELKWNSDKSVLNQDFNLPSLQPIADWLKINVEEEWNSANFKLLVNYIPPHASAPYIEFEKDVTPNISGETWNKITMDPDYSLDDYSTQWTIRHEFGHVLGFPDCYLEFYLPEKKEMIFYTIETDNLMCAWGGKLQPSHIKELQRAY